MARKVVVTGASSEIGMAICRRVLRAGDTALLHCNRRAEACEALGRSWGGDFRVLPADFRDAAAVEGLCREAAGAELLVHAAALTATGLLPDLEDAQARDLIAVNVAALVRICRAVVPQMVTRRAGCIVVVSSVAAHRANRGQSVYAGTKGFAEAFVRGLAAEYGARGIRVNCVAPGPVEAGSLGELLAGAREQVAASVTLPRLGTPEDVAGAVAYLASEDAAWITGQCLRVDGGFRHGV